MSLKSQVRHVQRRARELELQDTYTTIRQFAIQRREEIASYKHSTGCDWNQAAEDTIIPLLRRHGNVSA